MVDQVQIALRERDADATFVQSLLEILGKIELDRPVVVRSSPDSNDEINRTVSQLANNDLGCGILQDSFIRSNHGLNDRHRLVDAIPVTDAHNEVDSPSAVVGIIDNGAVPDGTVGDNNLDVIGRRQLGREQADVLHRPCVTADFDVLAHFEWAEDQ